MGAKDGASSWSGPAAGVSSASCRSAVWPALPPLVARSAAVVGFTASVVGTLRWAESSVVSASVLWRATSAAGD